MPGCTASFRRLPACKSAILTLPIVTAKRRTEAAVINVRAQMRATVKLGGKTQITYHQEWDTALFGTLQAENVMTLTLSENRWGIDWDANMIWPGLAGGNQLQNDVGHPCTRQHL